MSECNPVTCDKESRLGALEQQDNAISKAIERLDGKLDAILVQVSKIAVLETNHSHQSGALDRAFNAINTTSVKVESLEKFQSNIEGMARLAYILWASFGGGLLMLAVKVLFFMQGHGVAN